VYLVDDQLPTLNPTSGHLESARLDLLDKSDGRLLAAVSSDYRVKVEVVGGQLVPLMATTSTSPTGPENTAEIQGPKVVSTRLAARRTGVRPDRFPFGGHSATLAQDSRHGTTDTDAEATKIKQPQSRRCG
jgi:hypothetical protein